MSQHDALTTTDVVVVGAGLAGMTTAFELRRRGFDVTVVEQRFAGFGASGRNPGALWLQTCRSGIELAVARASLELYDDYVSELGDVFDFRKSGGLFFYETEEQGAVLQEYVRARQSVGLKVEMLSRAEAYDNSSLLPSTAIGAVHCADDAQLDSRRFVQAVADACTRSGVKIFDNTAVLSTIRRGDTVTGLRTVRGDVYASGVVWATGAWARNLGVEGIELPIRNARRGQIRTQPLTQSVQAIMHGPRGVSSCGALTDLSSFDAGQFRPPIPASIDPVGGGGVGAWDYDDSIVQGRDGSLHIGSSIDITDSLNPHISVRAPEAMITTTALRNPNSSEAGIVGLWAGLHSDTPDHLPIVDRVDGCFVNVGHSSGIGSAPVAARALACAITGEVDEIGVQLKADRTALDFAGQDVSSMSR